MTICNKKINFVKTSNRANREGSALAYILVIMTVVSIILVSIIQFIVSQIKYSSYNEHREKAFQVAEAGTYFYRWYLAHNVEGMTAQQVDDFWKNGNPLGVSQPYEIEYKDPQGGAIGKYKLEVLPPPKGATFVEVKATGWTYKYPEAKRIIKVRYRKPSWSEYAVLGGDSVRFGSGTDVYGKIFSNSGVHFDGVAHNIVISHTNSYYDNDFDVKATKPGVWTSWENEYNTDMGSNVFLSGKKYPALEKNFSSVNADLNLMQAEAISSETYYDNSRDGRYIILKGDKFDIRLVKSHNSTNSPSFDSHDSWSLNNPIPDDGVIYVEDNIWLEGTLGTAEGGKRLTIVAANLISGNAPNVFIGKDITYYNNQHDGENILGIVAQNDIEIIENSNDVLNIDGALLAQQGRVGREYYTSGCGCGHNSCEDHKDTITVYGALASYQRYGFSWKDNCPRNTGYTNRNIYYDSNLLYYPPPFFPTGAQYLLDLWEEL